MKIRILAILLIISMLLLLIASCDNANSIENKIDETIADTENNNKTESETNNSKTEAETIADTENNKKTEAETNNSQNSGNSESNGNSNNNISGGEMGDEMGGEMGETLHLSFLDYEDYLQFSKGIFKEEDSLVAQIIYEQFSNPKKSLIDVRSILDLPELTEKVHDQMIIMEANQLLYITHLYNNKGRPNINYYEVFIKYYPNKIQSYSTHVTEAPMLESLKERTDDRTLFKIQAGDHLVVYQWGKGKPFAVDVYSDYHIVSVSIGSYIEGKGVEVESVDDIKEICGELIASLFSENTEDIKAAVETIKSRLPQ